MTMRPIDHKLDQCACGDYRRDHKNGTGACCFNPSFARYPSDDGHSGAGACQRFRLSTRYAGVADGEQAAAGHKETK